MPQEWRAGTTWDALCDQRHEPVSKACGTNFADCSGKAERANLIVTALWNEKT
jgi:hypothetical protein